ncbi:MAG: DUF4465 domain-containing protein [Lewinellaceae bacterium]|nr:DUF4465 domain-containing protein [Lewinellaceae bacterium]
MRKQVFLYVWVLCGTLPALNAQRIAGFENFSLPVDTVLNGQDGSSGYASGDVFFPCVYSPDFGGYWASGWAVSTMTDSLTPGFGNLYSARPGSGANGSLAYAIGQQRAVLRLTGIAAGRAVQGLSVTNTAYTYYSMRDGDMFAKKFGGVTGQDPDFFSLTIRAWHAGVQQVDSVVVYLADFRSDDSAADFLLDHWQYVDVTSLGAADSLVFTLNSSDRGDFGINTPLFFALDEVLTYDPATEAAFPADSAAFVAWATGIDLQRGWQNIAQPDSGYASAGLPDAALGRPGENGTVSLGDGGIATLTFAQPITDGPGADFAVFENGFPASGGYFLELAFVEVSSDGENFVRFPAYSLVDTSAQLGAFGTMRPEQLVNLAGKFPARLGTPFDLRVLEGRPGLDISRITHVRLIDVVGSLDPAFASYDASGRPINDPWPTAFPSSGFDLDAVGVIHQSLVSATQQPNPATAIRVWPNPADEGIWLALPQAGAGWSWQWFDSLGRQLGSGFAQDSFLSLAGMPSGMGWLRWQQGTAWGILRVQKR